MTPQDREQFRIAGFVITDEVIAPPARMQIREQLADRWDGDGLVDGITYVRDNRIMDAWRECSAVWSLACDPHIQDIVQYLLGAPILPFQTLNFRRGTQQPVHQDTFHFNTEPSGGLCAVWVALEDVDSENGPLVYYPGSHKFPEVRARHLPGWAIDSYDAFMSGVAFGCGCSARAALLKAGQAIVWHGNLLHGGSRIIDLNRTRYSQVTHYFALGRKYYTPPRKPGEEPVYTSPEWVS